jgi:hypothetical protein
MYIKTIVSKKSSSFFFYKWGVKIVATRENLKDLNSYISTGSFKKGDSWNFILFIQFITKKVHFILYDA